MKSAYDEWHSNLEVDAAADSPWHELVRRRLPSLAGKRALEMACGRGGFAAWLAAQGPEEIVAMDYSEVAIGKAEEFRRKRGITNLSFRRGDIQAISCPDNAFDVVVSCETVEHVPEPKRAVRELSRVLKPGGTLFLTTPNYLGTLGLYRIYLRLRGRRFTEVGQPINQWTLLPRTIAWVREVGLYPVKVDAVGHYLPFFGRPPLRVLWPDRFPALFKWLAHHSLVVAEKG